MHCEASKLGLLNHRLLAGYTDLPQLFATNCLATIWRSSRVLPAALPLRVPEEGRLDIMPAPPVS
jgi:hypothetical protein